MCPDTRAVRAARGRGLLWRRKLTETLIQTVRLQKHLYLHASKIQNRVFRDCDRSLRGHTRDCNKISLFTGTRPERKVKITLRTEEKVPAKGEESYNGHI